MAEEDEVPPLEDMSEHLKKFTHEPLIDTTTQKTDQSLLKFETTQPLDVVHPDLLIVNESVKKKKPTFNSESSTKRSTPSESSFGGLKKGFLCYNRDKPKSKKKPDPADSMPYIKTKKTENNLKISEVQDEMNKSFPLVANSKEWLTADMLDKIDSNPVLSRGLTDPNISKALEKFRTNPEEAMKENQKNPQVMEFLQEFCKLMGDHFTSLADKRDSTHQEEQIRECLTEEEKKMKEALNDPKVQEVLRDANVQKLIELLKDDVTEAQRFLDSNRSSEFQSKVRLLIDYGVLNVQR
jgi:hypothetical protein